MFGWFKKAAKPPSTGNAVDIQAMLQIVDDWGEFMEAHPVGIEIVDEKLLPHPKERILDALCVNLALVNDEEIRGALIVGALTLAHYQPGIGPKALGPGGISPEFMRVAGSLPVEEAIKHLTGDPGAAARYEQAKRLHDADRERIQTRIDKADAVASQLANRA